MKVEAEMSINVTLCLNEKEAKFITSLLQNQMVPAGKGDDPEHPSDRQLREDLFTGITEAMMKVLE